MIFRSRSRISHGHFIHKLKRTGLLVSLRIQRQPKSPHTNIICSLSGNSSKQNLPQKSKSVSRVSGTTLSTIPLITRRCCSLAATPRYPTNSLRTRPKTNKLFEKRRNSENPNPQIFNHVALTRFHDQKGQNDWPDRDGRATSSSAAP